jgi:signal transduction histidine kinase
MLLQRLDQRTATVIRIVGLVLIGWSVLTSDHGPGASGRGLVVTILFAAAIVAWLVWTIWPGINRDLTAEVYVLAGAGGFLCGAAPDSGASVFAFVAVVTAGVRADLSRAWTVVAVAAAAVGGSVLIYNGGALTVLAYSLGFAVAALAASNARQSVARADQAELLLAQTQRSQEEQLRAARLEEATRIARDIHDVLAHALAGLAIQLEATASLIEQGADREATLARVRRARELAREGLRETRLAVGALRGDAAAAPAAIEALVADHRASIDAPAQLTIDGDRGRLAGPAGQAVLRVVQEALTNVRKHAPGSGVEVTVHAGSEAGDEIVVMVCDQPSENAQTAQPAGWLADAGGGYGVPGMRERAEALGGTLIAGPAGTGWQVQLRLPDPRAARAGVDSGAAVPS